MIGKAVQQSDAKRAQKLQRLLDRLKQGKNVQNRDLQTWLGAEGYKRFEEAWAAQKDLRGDLAKKPDAIVEYERKLKRANFTFNKAEGFSQRGKHDTAKALFGQADTEYERLLERLQEIVAADQSLRAWFDRDTTWDETSSHSLCPSGVPQVVTSKSLLNEARGAGVLSGVVRKQAVKISVIEQELSELTQGAAAQSNLLARRRKLDRAALHPEMDCS